MKIGDKVKFIGSNDRRYIPKYYTDSNGIPREILNHGSTRLGERYFKDFAKIVDVYKDFFIVEYEDENAKLVKLGFKTDKLELIKPLSWKEEMSL
jgi:hypothetical protein